MKDSNILIYWTSPSDDWLLGMEYIPNIMLQSLDSKEETSIFSIGFFIFRIDFLINNKEE